jgi:hypothetical protein
MTTMTTITAITTCLSVSYLIISGYLFAIPVTPLAIIAPDIEPTIEISTVQAATENLEIVATLTNLLMTHLQNLSVYRPIFLHLESVIILENNSLFLIHY